MSLADVTGASGVFLLLMAYLMAGIGKIDSQKLFYFMLNTIGSALACYASVLLNYIPFIVLETAWLIVSVAGLIRSISRQPTL
jgi:hypothetical protein